MSGAIEQDVQALIKSLKSNRFDPVEYVEKIEDTAQMLLSMIPPKSTVGIGGSTSLMQLGVRGELSKRSTITRSRPDIFLTSSNAITMDGKLVNTDMTGNRVSTMIFGPKQVIVVAGMNKVVKDIPAALERIRNVIVPCIARNSDLELPCVTEGRCTDCKSPLRLCTVTTVIEAKPRVTQISIILVGEDMGLSWDPDWEEERRERIASVFKEEWAKLRAARSRE